MPSLKPLSLAGLLAAALLVGVIGGATLYTAGGITPPVAAMPVKLSRSAPRSAPEESPNWHSPSSPLDPSAAAADASIEEREPAAALPQPVRTAPPLELAARASLAEGESMISSAPAGNGAPLPPHDPAASHTPYVAAAGVLMPARALDLPLVFQEAASTAQGLTPADHDVLQDLRDSFAREVGAGTIDPSNPVYARRWSAAQPANDAQLRLFYGAEFVNRLALEAAQAANARASRSGVRR